MSEPSPTVQLTQEVPSTIRFPHSSFQRRLIRQVSAAPEGTMIKTIYELSTAVVFGNLRVSEEGEAQGLDLTEHSESAYTSAA